MVTGAELAATGTGAVGGKFATTAGCCVSK